MRLLCQCCQGHLMGGGRPGRARTGGRGTAESVCTVTGTKTRKMAGVRTVGVIRWSPALQRSPSSLPGSLMTTFPTQFQPLPQMMKCSFPFWRGCLLWHSQICFPSSRYPHEPYHTRTARSTSVIHHFIGPIRNPHGKPGHSQANPHSQVGLNVGGWRGR